MTYCLGMVLREGLVLAADSRSNAGVDQVARVRKLVLMPPAEDRVVAIQAAGNLATTQSVVTTLTEALGSGDATHDLATGRTMFEVANLVGGQLRRTVGSERKYVQRYADPGASFLVSGQVAGEPPRLFEVYEAGNVIEASARSPFLQIGETKYGKPILDRTLAFESPLDEAAKLAMLSFDATVRSNLSVGLPIDLMIYKAGAFEAAHVVTIEEDDAYWTAVRQAYSQGLEALIRGLPTPPAAWGA